ncbi:MAG: hypothetical protein U1D67_08815 [Dehalococcoidia bacterium]|nr:hypothetical protein [Dehalococcoidia bacterium]
MIGLLIILSSWLLLNTINPQLLKIEPVLKEGGVIAVPVLGVSLCTDAEGKDCQLFNRESYDIGNLKGKVVQIKFDNSQDQKQVAVLHELPSYKGRCAICLNDGCNDGYNTISSIGGVSSINVFNLADSSPGEGVSLYEKKEYNAYCQPGECDRWPGADGYQLYEDSNLDKKGLSIKIEERGKYLAAVFEGINYEGECEVFTQNYPNLSDYPIGICGAGSNMACFRSIVVKPIQ